MSQLCLANKITPFSKTLDEAKSILIYPVNEVVAGFSTGQMDDDNPKEEERVVISYFRKSGDGVILTAEESINLKALSNSIYDSSKDPFSGWSGSAVIKIIDKNKKTNYWLVSLMNAGYLAFRPIRSLEQSPKDIQLYQYDISDQAYEVSFSVKSKLWTDQIQKIIKKANKSQ